MSVERAVVPLTVVGGYLGAGKTTLINHLLRHPDGRRIGVIVNDFGSIGIDVELLGDALESESGPIVSLPNGCVCCTIGTGLHDALAGLLARGTPLDHVVVEVSGVADPASAAAWATVPPFRPAGIVVLAAADSVRSLARDRYVGDEVRRQLVGAELIVVTKSDLCQPAELAAVEEWLDDVTGDVPRVTIVDGAAPASVILGIVGDGVGSGVGSGVGDGVGSGVGDGVGSGVGDGGPEGDAAADDHADRYVSWDWEGVGGVSSAALDGFLAALPAGVLRLKGRITLEDGTTVEVQGVGARSTVRPGRTARPDGHSALVAIGVRDLLDPDTLTRLAEIHLR